MLTIQLPLDKANLAEVKRRLNLSEGQLDEEFGLVNIDPKQNLYAIMVEEAATQQIKDPGVKGPFSNPPIEPFSVPKPPDKPSGGSKRK